jgi:hypothetical protein
MNSAQSRICLRICRSQSIPTARFALIESYLDARSPEGVANATGCFRFLRCITEEYCFRGLRQRLAPPPSSGRPLWLPRPRRQHQLIRMSASWVWADRFGAARMSQKGSSAAGRLAVSYAASLSLGRPPRVPFWRDALALAALRAEPPSSPICCIHRREPKAPSMSAGT